MDYLNKAIAERLEKIQRGEIPEGYKKVRGYIIPNQWNVVTLKDIISDVNAGVSVNSEDKKVDGQEFGVLKVGCVLDGIFNSDENKKILDAELGRVRVNPVKGRVIVSRANTPELVGSVGYIDKDYPKLFLSDKLWQLSYKVELEGKWLASILSTQKIKQKMSLLATGTSKSMRNISKESFLGLEIPMPSYQLQKQIVERLAIWDKAIELKQQLLLEKQKQKQALANKILVVNKKDKSTSLKIGCIIKESKEKSIVTNQYDILSVTKEGIFLQSEYFNRQIASEDNTGYRVVRKNNLVFSTMNLWMGSIDVLREYEVGTVSPACKVFEINEELVDIAYMKHFVKSDYMMNIYKLNSKQGASIVRRSLDIQGLLSYKVTIPTISEQKRIGMILDTFSQEINLLQQEIQALKKQKQGLMQLLLTGIIRVDEE